MKIIAASLIAAFAVAGGALADPVTATKDAGRGVGHAVAQTGRATGHAVADMGREVGHATAVTGRHIVRGVKHVTHHRHHHHHHHVDQ